MADGKVKATLIPSGIFRWQRFPFVPVRHSPWSHLQAACFPWPQGRWVGSDVLARQRKVILKWDVQIYKWAPSVLKTGGFGGVTGLKSFTPKVLLSTEFTLKVQWNLHLGGKILIIKITNNH